MIGTEKECQLLLYASYAHILANFFFIDYNEKKDRKEKS